MKKNLYIVLTFDDYEWLPVAAFKSLKKAQKLQKAGCQMGNLTVISTMEQYPVSLQTTSRVNGVSEAKMFMH